MEKKGNTSNSVTTSDTGSNLPSAAGNVSIQGVNMPGPLGTLHTSSYHGNDVKTPETGSIKSPEKRGDK